MNDENDHSGLQLERIVFFSDAVFAIAITLLIIEIKVPHLDANASDREFWTALAGLIPNFVGYFFSFFVIGAYWIGHHRIYGHISKWNYGLIWRNIFFLMAIAFIPFSTAFFSENSTRFVPLLLYAAVFSVAGVLQIQQWRYAAKSGCLGEAADEKIVDLLTWRIAVLPAAGVAAILIGLISPMFSGFAFILIPIAHAMIDRRFKETDEENERLADGAEGDNGVALPVGED